MSDTVLSIGKTLVIQNNNDFIARLYFCGFDNETKKIVYNMSTCERSSQ